MDQDRIKKKLSRIQWLEDVKKKVLLVDDEMRIAQEVKTLLEDDDYSVQIATNGNEAMQMIREYQPDLIMSEIAIRHINGFELCRTVKEDPNTKHIPVILITGLTRPNDKIKGIEAGATDFIGKPFDQLELKTRVRSAFRIKSLHARLENIDEVIVAFSRAVEARDPYTRGHSERVGMYAIKLAIALGMDERYREFLFRGAILHDIGKIGVRDSVLLKAGKLTDEEFDEIKKHPEIGLKICGPLKTSRSLLNIIAYHHERMDGTGYPFGLMGNEIPIEARIIAIADTFDALTSTRPYRKALSVADACRILNEGNETHFDEDFLPVFVEVAMRGEMNEVLEMARGQELAPMKPSQEIPSEIINGLDFFDANFIG
ncbi:response regulator [bacterium]|nr:response regulator [bacterium]